MSLTFEVLDSLSLPGDPAKANEDAIALMEKNGVKLIRPEREPFEKAVAGVHKYFSTMVGADLLKEVTDAQR